MTFLTKLREKFHNTEEKLEQILKDNHSIITSAIIAGEEQFKKVKGQEKLIEVTCLIMSKLHVQMPLAIIASSTISNMIMNYVQKEVDNLKKENRI